MENANATGKRYPKDETSVGALEPNAPCKGGIMQESLLDENRTTHGSNQLDATLMGDSNIGESVANGNSNNLKEANDETVHYIAAKYTYATDFWNDTYEEAREVIDKIPNDIREMKRSASRESKDLLLQNNNDVYQSLQIELNNRINSLEDILQKKIPFLPKEMKANVLTKIEEAKTAARGMVDNNIHQKQPNTHVQIKEGNEYGNQRNTGSSHVSVGTVSKNENAANTLSCIRDDNHENVLGYPINTIQHTHIPQPPDDSNLAASSYETFIEDSKNVGLNDRQFSLFRKLLERLRRQDEISSTQDEISSTQDEILRAMDEEIRDKDKQIQDRSEKIRDIDLRLHIDSEIDNIQAALYVAGSTINRHLLSVSVEAIKISYSLSDFSGLIQSDPTSEGSTRTTSSNPPIDPNIAPNDILPGRFDPYMKYVQLKEHAEINFDFNLFGDQQCENLKAVNDKLQSFIANGSTIIINDEIKGKIRNTIANLEGLLFRDVTVETEKKNVYYYPGAMANENDGFQPIFHLILRAVANCVPTVIPSIDADAQSLPTTKSFCHEVIVPTTTARCKHSIDFVIEDKSRFYIYLHDYAVQLVCVGRTGCRKSEKPLTILDDARCQAIGHVAKYITTGFNFAGIGTNTYGTCIVATLSVIQVLRLELSGVGTKDIKLQLKQSRMLPLMTKSNYEKWIHGTKYQKEFEELGKQLYPCRSDLDRKDHDDFNGYSKEHGIPLGLVCLFNLMIRQTVDLFGPKDLFKDNNVGPLVGRGTFSDIYSYKETHVIKISRYGISKGHQNEEKMLLLLKPDIERQGLTCLPIFHNYVPDFEANLGDLMVALPALETSPRGIVSTSAMNRTKNKSSKRELLSSIKGDISCALKFIHSKNVFHLDVAPKNIVIIPDEKSGRAVLIDFSVAWYDEPQRSNSLSGFIGTTSYTHRDIFYFYPSAEWTPHPKYDFVGLGYTLATLANEGKLPFSPFDTALLTKIDQQNNFEHFFEERDDDCCAAIDASSFLNRQSKREYKNIIKMNSTTGHTCGKRKNA